MQNKKKENSVKSLINLYTVVMGVSLSLAITKTVDTQAGLQSVTPTTGLIFVAFIVTLIPFYHGALRHLDDAYIENNNTNIKDTALILDFLLLLLHGIAFVVLAILIAVPNHFAWALIALLTIDVCWGLFAHFGSSTLGKTNAEWKWAIINFVFVGLSAWYLTAHSIYLAPMQNTSTLAIPIAFACIVRSLIDYIWAKEFYFPT